MHGIAIATVLSLGLAAGLTPSTPARLLETRQRLFQVAVDDPVQRALETRARLTVVYWPAVGKCTPCEQPVRESLVAVSAAYSDIRLLSVVPEAAEGSPRGARSAAPGEVVALPRPEYRRQADWSPLPRVEVWTAGGDLVLLESIPAPLGHDGGLLVVIESLRSLTAPLEESR